MLGGVKVVDLQQQAALLAGEGPVPDVGGPAGVRHRAEGPTAHGQGAGELEHLFPVFVDERLGGERARVEPQQAGPRPPPTLLVEMPREDLLFQPRGIARRDFPARGEIDRKELQVFLEHEPFHSTPTHFRTRSRSAEKSARHVRTSPGSTSNDSRAGPSPAWASTLP